MANAVAARMKGDEYQHLFAWLHALELLAPQGSLSRVIVEDAKALSADDVTLLHADGSPEPDSYHQVKFHVDYRDGYSVGVLTAQERGESSLLQKWFRSWERLLKERPGRQLKINVVSNWGWVPGDDLAGFWDGQTGGLKEEFFTATGRQKAALLRNRLAKHVSAPVPRFDDFARTLCFRLAYGCGDQLRGDVSRRMKQYNLKHDDKDLETAIAVVRKWVMSGRQEVTRADLDAALTDRSLWLPPEAKPSVVVYLTTILEQKFDVDPDYVLDWREYFPANVVRDRELADPAGWNNKLLPELRAVGARVGSETRARLVRARGHACLSAWFAFGSVFCDVAGYTIEVDQQGQLWQSDATPSPDFALTCNAPDGEPLDPDGDAVAVAVGVSSDPEPDVRRHLAHRAQRVKAVLFVRPARESDRHSLRDAGDAVALADGVKSLLREFVKRHAAKRLLLYYAGPKCGACFIGHRLNAVCREVQIYEWSDPKYVPSFTLT